MDDNPLRKEDWPHTYNIGEIMNELTWDIDEPMRISIKCNNATVMKISIYEVIESCRRKDVINHVKECDRTPWLKNWGAADEIVDILKGIK